MKKVVAIIMIIGIVGVIGVMGTHIQNQNTVINELKSSVQYKEYEIDDLNRENHELKDENENMNNEVYKMKNGEEYRISVHHDGKIHTWSGDGTLFGHSYTVNK